MYVSYHTNWTQLSNISFMDECNSALNVPYDMCRKSLQQHKPLKVGFSTALQRPENERQTHTGVILLLYYTLKKTFPVISYDITVYTTRPTSRQPNTGTKTRLFMYNKATVFHELHAHKTESYLNSAATNTYCYTHAHPTTHALNAEIPPVQQRTYGINLSPTLAAQKREYCIVC